MYTGMAPQKMQIVIVTPRQYERVLSTRTVSEIDVTEVENVRM